MIDDEMQPEYDFSHAERGKYAERYKQGITFPIFCSACDEEITTVTDPEGVIFARLLRDGKPVSVPVCTFCYRDLADFQPHVYVKVPGRCRWERVADLLGLKQAQEEGP